MLADWVGLIHFGATLLFRLSPPVPQCHCACAVDLLGGGGAAEGVNFGYSGALDRCLAQLATAGAPPAAPAAAGGPAPASLCSLVPAGVWLALGGLLFFVGLLVGLCLGSCVASRPGGRRAPAGGDIRPGAFTGPVSPASLRALQ
jgi:hypothetical protein